MVVQYSDPEGGYFVLANMAAVKLPADYPFPRMWQTGPETSSSVGS